MLRAVVCCTRRLAAGARCGLATTTAAGDWPSSSPSCRTLAGEGGARTERALGTRGWNESVLPRAGRFFMLILMMLVVLMHCAGLLRNSGEG